MVTRRQFVVGFTMASTALSSASPAAFSSRRQSNGARISAGPTATLVATEPNTVGGVTSTFTKRLAVPFVVAQPVQIKAPGPFTVTVTYDGRFFNGGDFGIASCGDEVEAAQTTVVLADSPEPSSLTYDVPDIFNDAKSVTVTLSLPLTPRDLYPEDAMDDVLPLVLVLTSKDGIELARMQWDTTVLPGEMTSWGAELAASWTSAKVIDGAGSKANKYRYPNRVVINSVGPADIPVGTTLTLEHDASIITSCAIATITPGPWASDAYSAASAVDGGVLRTVVTLNQPVPASTSIEVTCDAAAPTDEPTVSSVVYAVAHLSAPANDSLWQRPTNKYVVTDLTPSGNPLVPGVAAGTI